MSRCLGPQSHLSLRWHPWIWDTELYRAWWSTRSSSRYPTWRWPSSESNLCSCSWNSGWLSTSPPPPPLLTHKTKNGLPFLALCFLVCSYAKGETYTDSEHRSNGLSIIAVCFCFFFALGSLLLWVLFFFFAQISLIMSIFKFKMLFNYLKQ